MLHFFQPTQRNGHRDAAAKEAGLSEFFFRPGYPVKVGLQAHTHLFGVKLDLRVFRNMTRVSGSPTSPVKLSRTVDDKQRNTQVYTITGLRNGDKLVGVRLDNSSEFTREIPVREIPNTPSGLMWEAATFPGTFLPGHRAICSFAVSYLALSDEIQGGMTVLDDTNTGGPLMTVHGLSVHTTAGKGARSKYLMARWGCVETWNRGGHKASAHFGVAWDGTLVQFVPVNYVAHAQYSPGNEHWISVEVDTKATDPMNERQLASVKKLFWWVCNNFGVSRQLATGCLFPKQPHFDKLTAEVCARGNVATTTDPYEACMSRGLSCHWWLEGNKTANSHHCPGPGILKQLDAVARG